MSQIHSLNVTRLTTSMLFSYFFQSLNSSLIRTESLLFFIAKHLLPNGCRCRRYGGECNKRAQTANRMSFFREKRYGSVKTA